MCVCFYVIVCTCVCVLGKPVIDTGSPPNLCSDILYKYITYTYTYPVMELRMHASVPSSYVGIGKPVITVVWQTLLEPSPNPDDCICNVFSGK